MPRLGYMLEGGYSARPKPIITMIMTKSIACSAGTLQGAYVASMADSLLLYVAQICTYAE